MLRKTKHRGEAAVEYVVIAAIAIAVLGVAIWGIVQAASGEGSSVADWIGNISVPISP